MSVQLICPPHGEPRESDRAMLVDVDTDQLTLEEKHARSWPEVVRALSRFVPEGHYIAEIRQGEAPAMYMRPTEEAKPVLVPGNTAEMWHAGTRRFYHVTVNNISMRGPLPCE